MRIYTVPPLNQFVIEGNTVWIKLTQGKETCIDLVDWPEVQKYRWHATKQQDYWYAIAEPVDNQRIKLHRLLCPTSKDIDHKDGNTLNNQRFNIRPATKTENMQNRRVAKSNKVGLKGVFQTWNRFSAKISVNKRAVYLGSFSTAEEAAQAYDTAARTHFKSFARLNFPGPGPGEQSALN